MGGFGQAGKAIGVVLAVGCLGACALFRPLFGGAPSEPPRAETPPPPEASPDAAAVAASEPARDVAEVAVATPPGGVRAAAAATPLILDIAVSQEIRQAATCEAFNAEAPNYLLNADADVSVFASDAAFWRAELERVAPDPAYRGQLLESARARMTDDFPLQGGPADGAQQFRNGDFARVLLACGRAREALPSDG